MTMTNPMMRSHPLAVAAITLAAMVLGWPNAGGAATLAEIKQRGYMVVVTEDDFRPFEFVKDGKPTGFDNELLERLRKFAPFEIRQEIIPWPEYLRASAPEVRRSPHRRCVTNGGSHSTSQCRWLTIPTTPSERLTKYQSVADLNGKSFGFKVGSVMKGRMPELQAMLNETSGKLGAMTEYNSFPDAYQDLANGRIDYVINTYINLSELVREKPNVFELGQKVSGRLMPAWAVKKGNAGVLAFLNSFLAQERESGGLASLQTKWFGKSFDDLPLYWMSEF